MRAFVDRVTFGYAGPLLGAVLLSFAARSLAMVTPLMSIDGYSLMHPGATDDLMVLTMSQGRYANGWLYELRDALGIFGPRSAPTTLPLSVLLHAHAGLLFLLSIARRPTQTQALVFLALFALHPFYTEVFTFSEATLNQSIALWAAAAGLYLAMHGHRWVSIASLVPLVLALATYQTVIAYVLAACALAFAAWLLDGGEGRRVVRASLLTITSIPLYLVTVRIVATVTGTKGDARTTFETLVSDPVQKLRDATAALARVLEPWSLVPSWLSMLLAVTVVGAGAIVAWQVGRRRGWVAAITTVGLLAASVFVASGLGTVGDLVSIVPRLLIAVALPIAAIVMLAWPFARPAVLGSLVVVLCLGWMAASQRILVDQQSVNRQDAAFALRIVERLPDARTIIIRSVRWPYVPPMTWAGELNTSALLVGWTQTGLLEYATGQDLGNPTDADRELVRDACLDRPPWPAVESTFLVGDIGVVCLTV